MILELARANIAATIEAPDGQFHVSLKKLQSIPDIHFIQVRSRTIGRTPTSSTACLSSIACSGIEMGTGTFGHLTLIVGSMSSDSKSRRGWLEDRHLWRR